MLIISRKYIYHPVKSMGKCHVPTTPLFSQSAPEKLLLIQYCSCGTIFFYKSEEVCTMKPFRHAVLLILASTIVSLPSCSSVRDLMKSVKIRPPTVKVESTRLTRLTFSGLDLLFDLKIENPNQVGLKLSGFSYELMINNSSFVAGEQTRGIEIAAQGDSIVQLPVNVEYKRLFETFQSLVNEERSSYELRCVFSFNVPVLGDVSVPLSKEGELPVLRFPRITLDALRIVRLGLTTASLELNIFLANPNPIGLSVEDLEYALSINSHIWASGSEMETAVIPSNGGGILRVPIDIRVLDVGRSAYALIEKEESARFQLSGSVGFSTTLPIMGHTDLPFELSGNLRIMR